MLLQPLNSLVILRILKVSSQICLKNHNDKNEIFQKKKIQQTAKILTNIELQGYKEKANQ